MIEDMSVEQWLAIRKEAGLKIDPETAEVINPIPRVASPCCNRNVSASSCVGKAMQQREFIKGIAVSSAWPLAAQAQQ